MNEQKLKNMNIIVGDIFKLVRDAEGQEVDRDVQYKVTSICWITGQVRGVPSNDAIGGERPMSKEAWWVKVGPHSVKDARPTELCKDEGCPQSHISHVCVDTLYDPPPVPPRYRPEPDEVVKRPDVSAIEVDHASDNELCTLHHRVEMEMQERGIHHAPSPAKGHAGSYSKVINLV